MTKQQQLDYYQAFFENSLDMLCIAGNDGYFKLLNPSWTTTLGFTQEELKSKPFVDFVHPDDRQATIDEANRLSTGEHQTVSFINRYACKDGSYKWLLWSASPFKDTKMAVARDITEIKERDQFYSEMQSVAKIGSWKYHVNTQKIVWSEQTYKICQIPIGTEVTTQTIYDFCHKNYRPQFDGEVHKVLQEGQAFDHELKFTAAQGTTRWVRLIGYPVINQDKVVAVEGVVQDISKRKAIENKLEIEKVRSFNASRLAALGEMAGGIAHEINNPLEIINLAAKKLTTTIEKPNFNTDDLYEGCDRIMNTVQRIAKIIRGLQNLARDGSSDLPEKATVGDILEDVLSACSQRFESSGILLQIEDNGLMEAKINCRKVELSQVLLNLMNNAFDATLDSQQKWVRIRLSEYDAGKCLRIHIEDSGPGIEKIVAERIMDPFFTTKPMGRGTGLGLSISKAIANSHRGNLEFVGNVPHTEFALTLPLNEI